MRLMVNRVAQTARGVVCYELSERSCDAKRIVVSGDLRVARYFPDSGISKM